MIPLCHRRLYLPTTFPPPPLPPHPVIWGEIKPRGLLGVEPRVNPEQPKLGVCRGCSGLLGVARGLLGVARGLLGIDRNPSIIY